MVCRDIKNYYPSSDTQKCQEAFETLLEIREIQTLSKSLNSTKINERFLTQIDTATTGSPESGSIMEMFGVIYIDKKFIEECPKKA